MFLPKPDTNFSSHTHALTHTQTHNYAYTHTCTHTHTPWHTHNIHTHIHTHMDGLGHPSFYKVWMIPWSFATCQRGPLLGATSF